MPDDQDQLKLSGPITDEAAADSSVNPIDQTIGMEARVMLKSVRVPDDGTLTDSLKDEIRRTVQEHVAKNKITLREVAVQIGYNESVVSEVLRAKYKRADDTPILLKLNGWIDDDERRRRRAAPIGFYPTSVFDGVKGLALWAKSNARIPGSIAKHGGVTQDPARIAVGWGPAGCGKSLAAAALHAEDTLSILVRVEQRRGTDAGLAQLIIESAGWRGAKADRARSGVSLCIDKLRDSGRLLIIDEAHRLKASGCELLRDLADVCGIPILLLGTQEFYQRMTMVRTRSGNMFYDQFSRRVGFVLNLIRGLDGKGGTKRPIFSLEEVQAIFKADNVRVTSDAIEYLCAVSCVPGLGMLGLAATIFEKALRAALRRNRVIDAELLRKSAQRVLIPAGEEDPEILVQIERSLEVNRAATARVAAAG